MSERAADAGERAEQRRGRRPLGAAAHVRRRLGPGRDPRTGRRGARERAERCRQGVGAGASAACSGTRRGP
jgi:hypothetical protein